MDVTGAVGTTDQKGAQSVPCTSVDCVCMGVSHHRNDWFVWMSTLGLSVHPKDG